MLTSFSKFQEDFQGMETKYVKILTYDLKEGLKDNYKSYAYNRICTIAKGKKEITINNDTHFNYDKNKFVHLAPYSSVHMHIIEHTNAIVFEISDRLIDRVHQRVEEEVEQDVVKDELLVSDVTEELKQPMIKMTKAVTSPTKGKEFIIDLYAQELVYNLMYEKHLFANENREKDLADIAIEIMVQPGNEDITIGEIASILRVSNANLTYMFKQKYGMSPKQYHNMFRIKKAKDLLGDYNVTEVASKLGFTNISYFIRMFKSNYGITPKQYKLHSN